MQNFSSKCIPTDPRVQFALTFLLQLRLCAVALAPGRIVYTFDKSIWLEEMRHEPVAVWEIVVVGCPCQ